MRGQGHLHTFSHERWALLVPCPTEEVWWKPVCSPDLPQHSVSAEAVDTLGGFVMSQGTLLYFDEMMGVRDEMLFAEKNYCLREGELGS